MRWARIRLVRRPASFGNRWSRTRSSGRCRCAPRAGPDEIHRASCRRPRRLQCRTRAPVAARRVRYHLPMRLPSRVRAWTVALAAPLFIAVITTAQSPQTSSDRSRRESFDDLYRRGHQTSASIQTLTANFTETSTSSLLARPLVARGTLALQRPARVIMRFIDPEQRVILIDGDRMTTSWPARKLREVSNISSAQGRVQKYIAAKSADELRRQFDVEQREASERPRTFEVTLLPKRKQIRDTMT